MAQVLDVWTVAFNYVAPVDCAKIECVCKQWRAVLAERNQWWKKKCLQDFSLTEKIGPEKQPCETYKIAYSLWYSSFNDLDLQIVRRACRMWKQFENWMIKNDAIDMLNSLQPPLTKQQIQKIQEEKNIQLPQCVQAIYRIHNGSDGVFSLLGGYQFYDHSVNLKMKALRSEDNCVIYCTQLVVGQSVIGQVEKLVTVDCGTGDVWIPTLSVPFNWWFANPQGGTGKKDGFLCWMEEYVKRLTEGTYNLLPPKNNVGNNNNNNNKYQISLLPRTLPLTSKAVTRGIQVEASVVFVPETSWKNKGKFETLRFTYSIRFKMVEQTPEFRQAQLVNRCWTIVNSEDEAPKYVEGPGVIGEHPIVSMGREEYVYQSCTVQSKSGGYMYGHFEFIEGTRDIPTGPLFQVECPRFQLIIPNFIF